MKSSLSANADTSRTVTVVRTYVNYMTPPIFSPCHPVTPGKTKISQPCHLDLLRAFKRRAPTGPANFADFYLADKLHAEADLLTLRYN